MRVLPAIPLVLLIAAVTACGGSADSGSDGTRSKRAIQTEAQQRAESMLLEIGDLPNGWRASPSDTDAASQERFRKCLGMDYSALTIIGEADSKDFAHEDTTEASSTSTVFETEDQAEEAMRELSEGMNSAGAEDCFRDIFEEAIHEGSASGDVKVTDLDVGELSVGAPSDVAETNPWQVAVSLEATSGESEGVSISAYLDYVAMREGDAATTVLTYDVLSPFDPSLRNDLLRAVADRMTATAKAE